MLCWHKKEDIINYIRDSSSWNKIYDHCLCFEENNAYAASSVPAVRQANAGHGMEKMSGLIPLREKIAAEIIKAEAIHALHILREIL